MLRPVWKDTGCTLSRCTARDFIYYRIRYPALGSTTDVGARDPLEAERIEIRKGIAASVKEGIQPSVEPDRVALDVPAGDCVIIAEVVVIQPRLLVKVLARQYYDAAPS